MFYFMKQSILNRPYSQSETGTTLYREFLETVDEEELVWHRDRRDREVELLEPTDWMFQFDNEIPFLIKDKIFIPRETYHRLIKGTQNLRIKINEL